MGTPADYRALVDQLYALKPRGGRLGIDRMRPLAAALGNPERTMPVVHVAGTNGKGSVAAMIEAMLRAAGWRVGLYTSPHLIHLGERVQVNRERLTDEEIVAFVTELTSVSEQIEAEQGAEMRPSFFEWMTAMAFLTFARARCDIAVIEVGLGGEFDATNIVEPEISVITSIGLDHCEWLGNSLEDIARAKAGIIKPGRPVVMGRMPPGEERVIRETAERKGARCVSVREIFGEDIEAYPRPTLAGAYQRWNAGTAVLAARMLGGRWRMTDEIIGKGLASAAWPGRWETREVGGRTVILDASHNSEGAETLQANLAQLRAETGRQPIVVLGVLGVERAGPLLEAISRHARAIHLIEPRDVRAVPVERLQSLVPREFSGAVIPDRVSRLFPGRGKCEAGEAGDVVVVTGSIYSLGEVMARLERSS